MQQINQTLNQTNFKIKNQLERFHINKDGCKNKFSYEGQFSTKKKRPI